MSVSIIYIRNIPVANSLLLLALKMPNKIVADVILFLYYFSEKIKPNISCELSALNLIFSENTLSLYSKGKSIRQQVAVVPLRKYAYSNTLKILQPKNEKFQIKNSDIFHISAQKHRLWVLVRTASLRRF